MHAGSFSYFRNRTNPPKYRIFNVITWSFWCMCKHLPTNEATQSLHVDINETELFAMCTGIISLSHIHTHTILTHIVFFYLSHTHNINKQAHTNKHTLTHMHVHTHLDTITNFTKRSRSINQRNRSRSLRHQSTISSVREKLLSLWQGGSISRALDSESNDKGLNPIRSTRKNCEFFRVKKVVLTCCRCAQPLCVHAHTRMIIYAR